MATSVPGTKLGAAEGISLGFPDGVEVGSLEGAPVTGASVGLTVGTNVGTCVGLTVAGLAFVGSTEGGVVLFFVGGTIVVVISVRDVGGDVAVGISVERLAELVVLAGDPLLFCDKKIPIMTAAAIIAKNKQPPR